jgi:hypothetical protein
MQRLAKTARLLALILAALFSFNGPSFSQSAGEIRLNIVSGGFILGGSGGGGTLFYKGKAYPLDIGGVSLGVTIGLARAQLRGQVYNLRYIGDIDGTYTATNAGYALIQGRKSVTLKNSRGVVLVLSGRQVGLEATVDVSGIQISLR